MAIDDIFKLANDEWERLTNLTLGAPIVLDPSQPEYVFLKVLAYVAELTELKIEIGTKSNLIQTATGQNLDLFGQFFGIDRLPSESDDRYRSRIVFAFGGVGSATNYQAEAMKADPSIITVGVLSPKPMEVEIYPLTDTGIPSAAVIAAVTTAVTSDSVRAVCDRVRVFPPSEIQYEIEGQIELEPGVDRAKVIAAIEAAAQSLIERNRLKLGGYPTPLQLSRELGIDGVKRVDFTTPEVEAGVDMWANGIGVNLTYV